MHYTSHVHDICDFGNKNWKGKLSVLHNYTSHFEKKNDLYTCTTSTYRVIIYIQACVYYDSYEWEVL